MSENHGDTSKHTHHSIDYIEIPATDLAAAKKFFASAFGWTFNDYGPAYAGISRVGEVGEMGGMFQAETRSVSNGYPLVILYSKSLEDSLARVSAAGGKIVKPIFDFPGGKRFQFEDLSGNQFGVWGEK